MKTTLDELLRFRKSRAERDRGSPVVSPIVRNRPRPGKLCEPGKRCRGLSLTRRKEEGLVLYPAEVDSGTVVQ
ncbi:hypothetical protein K0M31_018697, partial [Melipona bicolor]